MDRKDIAIALLRAIDIQELEYALSGGGDSGEATLERIQHVDGRHIDRLPTIPVGIDGGGRPYMLADLLDGLVTDLPEGDWINNEGGYGTVTIRPFEDDEYLCFDCDMTYGEEDDGGDDDEEFVDEDDDDADHDEVIADREVRP